MLKLRFIEYDFYPVTVIYCPPKGEKLEYEILVSDHKTTVSYFSKARPSLASAKRFIKRPGLC